MIRQIREIGNIDARSVQASDRVRPRAGKLTLNGQVFIVMLYGLTTFCSTFASSVFSPAINYVAAEFDISREVAVLGISTFVLGYSFGPLLFAPLSEMYGRKLSVLAPMLVFACFAAGTAAAKDIQTVFITRFVSMSKDYPSQADSYVKFGGIFASAPIISTGGSLADVFDHRERASAVALYSLAVIVGPTIGPIAGSAVSSSSLGYRWTSWLVVIITCTVVAIDILILPETYVPTLLTRKARRLRWSTGYYALHSKQEMQPISIRSFATKNLILPIKMILMEPMVTCIVVYNSFT